MKTAFIVDDEPITRIDLAEMLEELGFRVVGSAADGFDAIELCRKHRPDVVLMDVKMPIFDGLFASEVIVAEDLAGCVVLLTAYCDSELIERANQIGVAGYLVKPVEQRLLLPALRVAIAQGERLRAARSEAENARKQLEIGKLIDRAKSLVAAEQGISEAEAYRELQRLAMDKRCTLASLAKAVVEKSSQRELINRAKEQLMQNHGLSEAAAFKQLQTAAKAKNGDLAAAAREVLATFRPAKGQEPPT